MLLVLFLVVKGLRVYARMIRCLMNQAYGKHSGTGIMLRTEGRQAPTCS